MPTFSFSCLIPMTHSPPQADYTEADIRQLVTQFYAQVRQDVQLGPIFEHHVQDWDEHLDMLCDFWSAILLGTRRFKGAPIARHAALPELSWPLFERWLEIFHQTTANLGKPALQEKADAMADRIAAKLWQTYQAQSNQTRLPDTLPEGLERYSQSPVFTPDNLPEALRRAHNTKAGTWGLLRVQTGVLRFALDQEPFTEVVLTAGQCVAIEPQILHHVEFELPGSFQIEFFKQAR